MKKNILLFVLIFTSFFTVFAKLNAGFYRIRSNSSPSKYIKINNDTINSRIIIGSASSVTTEDGQDKAMIRAQKYIQLDIKTISTDDRFADPGSVIYFSPNSGSSKEFDFRAQGIGIKYMTTAIYVGDVVGTVPIEGSVATLTETQTGSGLFTASITLTASRWGIPYEMKRYLGYNDGNIVLIKEADIDESCYWYIEPMDDSNYFSALPLSGLYQNNKYYTSLRTAFSYTVPTSSKVKVWEVTGLPDEDGGLATTEEVSSVSSGFPVIIESESLEKVDNKLEPTTPVAYLDAKKSSSYLITPYNINSSSILYNNYGYHGHDIYAHSSHSSYTGWLPKGNNIGFFKNKYNYGVRPTIYKLGMYHGAVGFWGEALTATDEVSGNEAYSPKRCQLFPVEKDLAKVGVDTYNDITYKVSPLTVAYIDLEKKLIIANDGNGAERQTGDNDFMNENFNINSHADHSNWVAIEVESVPNGLVVNDKIDVTGKVPTRVNRTIQGKAIKNENVSDDYTFTPNTYCIANFSTDKKGYFFATPQPNEVCNIVWAMWDNDTQCFIVPPRAQNKDGNFSNGPGFEASIPTNFDYFGITKPTDEQDGHVFSFKALVRKNESQSAPMLKDETTTDFVLYPLEALSDDGHIDGGVYTSISDVATCKITGVKYYNTMGVESDVPFKGVNIVVTTYDNGNRTTTKLLK